MTSLTDLIAGGYRNARAMSAVVVIFAAVGAMAVMKCQNAADPFLGADLQIGLLVQVTEQVGEPLHKNAAERRSYFGVVQLADSTEIEVQLPKPPPSVGDRIPLRCEQYQSGKRIFSFDHQEWTISGPR